MVFRRFLTLAFFSMLLISAMSCGKDDNQREVDEMLIQDFITANNLTTQTTGSGLHYIIDVAGNNEHPSPNSLIEILYHGSLLNGSVFDSTGTETREFPLNQLIVGWQEGIPLFGKGGSGMLILPSHLAYGPGVRAGIPPNSVLVFDITLVDFE